MFQCFSSAHKADLNKSENNPPTHRDERVDPSRLPTPLPPNFPSPFLPFFFYSFLPNLLPPRGEVCLPPDPPLAPAGYGLWDSDFSMPVFVSTLYNILATFEHPKRQKFIQQLFKMGSQIDPKTKRKLTWELSENREDMIRMQGVKKPKKSCSRVSSVYIYTSQLVSKPSSNNSKQTNHTMMLKMIPFFPLQ